MIFPSGLVLVLLQMFYTKVTWFKMLSLDVCEWDRGAGQEGTPPSGPGGATPLPKVHSHRHCRDGSGNMAAPCFTAAPSIEQLILVTIHFFTPKSQCSGEKLWNKMMNIISVLKM